MVLFDQRGPVGAAAERLQPQGAGAGEQVDGVLPRMLGPIRLKTASRRRSFMGRVRDRRCNAAAGREIARR